MDSNHLSRYFPLHQQADPDIIDAQDAVRATAHEFAACMNRLLPEGQAKNEMLMRLMHLAKDVELALSLDGVSRVTSPIVMTRQ